MASLNPEQVEFQDHARRWLDENRPAPPRERLPITPLEIMTEAHRDYLQDWQGKVYRAGLVGADYPIEYGGFGHDGFQRIANQEMARARTPMLINIVGLNMAGPTILAHGNEEQKKLLIPGCLNGEEIWCQGFSEPGAGSDMANQQTSATRDGSNWVINGHKVWTSLGHFAKWMILIARTSKHHKYDGLTYFLMPIAGRHKNHPMGHKAVGPDSDAGADIGVGLNPRPLSNDRTGGYLHKRADHALPSNVAVRQVHIVPDGTAGLNIDAPSIGSGSVQIEEQVFCNFEHLSVPFSKQRLPGGLTPREKAPHRGTGASYSSSAAAITPGCAHQ